MLRRALRILLCVVMGIALFVSFVWPTARAFVVRREVLSALRHAQAVRLEEYDHSETLTSVELPRADWPDIARAFPIVPDVGLLPPGVVLACFIPHHRIVIVRERGEPFVVEVCFNCDQIATGPSGILGTPFLWRGPIRRLLAKYGIPIRDSSEYTEMMIRRLQSRRPLPTPTVTPEARSP